MKKLIWMFFALPFFINAQDVTIYDFETPETSGDFQHFGSTLEEAIAPIIANPDASGANASGMVMEFVKPAGSEVWAGAFANPGPNVNLMGASQICIDVWYPEAGNLALKLENSPSGGADWILTSDISDTNQWTNICYDLTAASIEDPMLPAVGNEYNGLVLFADFGASLDADRTYYIDNIVVVYGGSTEATANYTIDMSEYEGDIDTVFLSGSFNNWSLDTPMTDQGDGTWTVDVIGNTGPVEYLYYVKVSDTWEQFGITDNCVKISYGADGEPEFINRQGVLLDGASVTDCWESCFACGDAVNITFNLGFADNLMVADSVYLAGGGNFENPGGRFRMTDPDGDGIYSITIERERGFTSFYTFANGPCPDFSCKENIGGQDCADPDNFNDRFLDAVMDDTVISTCFGECREDTDCSVAEITNITFQVDMSNETVDAEGVFFAGTITGWQAEPMTDLGDNIWSISYQLGNGPVEYKFLNGTGGWEEFSEDEPCTMVFDDGGNVFINRFIDIDGSATDILEFYCFNQCSSVCVSSNQNLTNNPALFEIKPNVIISELNITIKDQLESLEIFSTDGRRIKQLTQINSGTHGFDFSDLESGMYYVKGIAGNEFKLVKIVKQ